MRPRVIGEGSRATKAYSLAYLCTASNVMRPRGCTASTMAMSLRATFVGLGRCGSSFVIGKVLASQKVGFDRGFHQEGVSNGRPQSADRSIRCTDTPIPRVLATFKIDPGWFSPGFDRYPASNGLYAPSAATVTFWTVAFDNPTAAAIVRILAPALRWRRMSLRT